jgi:sterol desaturase/sphingolipid hydroxylase (fatty acid hydroxylase superfamily)
MAVHPGGRGHHRKEPVMNPLPDPLTLLLDPLSLVVFAIYAALLAWEAVAPARPLPPVRRWRALAFTSFGVYFLLSSYLPLLWSDALGAWQLVDLSALGTWAGAAVGLVVYELAAYAYHRTIHASGPLFRAVHQMHHSAERLDAASAFWFHPLDMIGWTAVFSLALTLVVGLAPEATTVVLLATTFMAIFQHSNVRTPRWLGYVVQRPESHSYHHERGVHARNYADLPMVDLLFGTFHNPPGFAPETGFADGDSRRVLDLLLGRNLRGQAVASTAHPGHPAGQVPAA